MERGAQPRNTRVRGQDDGVQNKLPQLTNSINVTVITSTATATATVLLLLRLLHWAVRCFWQLFFAGRSLYWDNRSNSKHIKNMCLLQRARIP